MLEVKHKSSFDNSLVLTNRATFCLNKEQLDLIEQYSSYQNHFLRKFFQFKVSGKYDALPAAARRSSAKSILQYHLPYRALRGIEQTVDGMIQSQKSNADNRIVILDSRLKDLHKKCKTQIGKIEKLKEMRERAWEDQFHQEYCDYSEQLNKAKRDLFGIQRGITWREAQINNLKSFTPNAIFGGAKLLKQRHEIAPENVTDWKRKWRRNRTSEFVLVGDSGDSMGNMICQIKNLNSDKKTCDLQFRMHGSALRDGRDHLLNIENVQLHGNIEHIEHAVGVNSLPKTCGVKRLPITYRFKRHKTKNQWQAFITVKYEKPEAISSTQDGSIGVDINVDHLAICEIDRNGNRVKSFDMPLNLDNKTSNQRENEIYHAAKRLVDYAAEKQKVIILESLDFKKKRAELFRHDSKTAHKLSAFSYKKIKDAIFSRSYKSGIEIKYVNPANTSRIGEIKYMDRYSISRHQAAAMVIARRGAGYVERSPIYRLPIAKHRNTVVRASCKLLQSSHEVKLAQGLYLEVKKIFGDKTYRRQCRHKTKSSETLLELSNSSELKSFSELIQEKVCRATVCAG